MEEKIVEVSFDSLMELDYLNLMNDQIINTPKSIYAEALYYDNHHVLLVAAFGARDYLFRIYSLP